MLWAGSENGKGTRTDEPAAAGLLTSEAIERLAREAIRKAAAEQLIEYGRRAHALARISAGR